MQLKILISIICLILSSNTVFTTRLLKAKENTSLRSNTIKNSANQQVLGGPSSQYTWTMVPAMRLFKEVGLTIFNGQNPLEARKCLDDIENNSDLGATPYKNLWDQCVQINKEFFSKQQMEAQAKGGSIPQDRLASLKAFSNWDDLMIAEYKNLINHSRSDFMKKECIPQFAKTRGNVYDLLNILQKPEYMGNKVTGNKNQQFIDSQYSIYRRTIAPGSFKRLNDASDKIMSTYRHDLSVIQGQKRGIKESKSPYDQKALANQDKNITPVIYRFIFYKLHFNIIY